MVQQTQFEWLDFFCAINKGENINERLLFKITAK